MNSASKLNHIELEISNPCNEKCLHCYRLCEHTQKGFLTSKQAKDVLSQAKNLGASSVAITGGELLLNSEWKDICKVAEDLGFQLSLYTNGTLITETVGDFIEKLRNLKFIQISLYSLNPDIHDEITGVKGSFLKTYEGIKILRERNIPVFISCPCMKENKDSVPDLMRWCDSNKIPSCCDLFIFAPSDYSNSNLCHQLKEDEFNSFFDETMKNKGELSYIWGQRNDCDIKNTPFFKNSIDSLCISGDGSIYPMIGWYECLGNINTDSLKDVFENNPLLKKIRKIMISDIPACNNCDLVPYCFFCPSIHLCANNGELYKIDETFCNFIKLRKSFILKRDELYGTQNYL